MTGEKVESRPRRVRDDLGAVAVGAVGAAIVRQGAFHPVDAVLFPAILLAVAALARCRVERRWRPTLALLAALAAWWLVAAFGWGRLADALPLFGSFVGFGAAAVLTANLSAMQRMQLRRLVILGTTTFAATGLVAVALRAYPLATQAQGLWRLSGTLTYANAAGLLLAMTLPLALAERASGSRWSAVAVTVVSGALVATMSRGALLALLVSAPLLRDLLRRSWWPLLLGGAVGVTAVATASSAATQPVVLAAATLAGALALVRPPARLAVVAGVVAAAAITLAVPGSREGIADAAERRVSIAELDSRTPEWRGAAREFAAAPLVGVGPERPFLSVHSGRTELAKYAHSEPLQIAASAGLVGVLLLAGVVGTLSRVVKTGDPSARPARAGLLVFAVGGVADFSWHLPALGIVGGVLAALAADAGRDT